MKTTAKFNTTIYCLLVFCMAGILPAQVIFIPDANFKNKLLEASPSNPIAQDENGNAITIDTNQDGEIGEDEALTVFELDVHGAQISDLSGIEYFTNLTRLDCSGNNLGELDLSSNPDLNFLWMLDNPGLYHVNVKNGSTFEGIGETDWINIWGNLPDNCYVCADDFEVAHIQSFLNFFGTTGKHVSSYCTFQPGGDFNTITGSLIFDTDGNGNCEAPDLRLPFLKIHASDGLNYHNSSFTDDEGNYIFFTQNGIFPLSLQLENPQFFQPLSGNARGVFPLVNNETETINICILSSGFHPDLEVVISPITPATPGGQSTYKLIYRNKGNKVLSGNLNFYFDDSRLDFVSSNPNITANTMGQLGYNFTNLAPFEKREIVIVLDINAPTGSPGVNPGDTLSFSAVIKDTHQLDAKPDDNLYELNQVVVNVPEPNAIICLEGDVIGTEDVGQELHYLIRFTNTGIYPAENVVVTLEVDPEQYEVASLRLLDTSHPAKGRMTGNKLEVFFQSRMETGGHGNILLVMKTKENLREGDYVKTRASIYFDSNYPVRTGEATTFIEELMATADPDLNASVSVYPNPVKEEFTIRSEDQINSVEIFEMTGKLIRTSLINDTLSIQNIRSLNAGIYLLRIRTEKGTIVQKLIKQ